MTPEVNIRNVLPDLYIERFPEGEDISYPRGIVVRVSQSPLLDKDRNTNQFTTRLEIRWYENDPRQFDTKRNEITSSLYSIIDGSTIKNVIIDDIVFDHDTETNKSIMKMRIIVKHF